MTTVVGSLTTTYGWKAGITNDTYLTLYGGKDLTTGSGNIGIRGSDHLGYSTYSKFDGTNNNTFSSDAAFAFTGQFSIGIWVSRASWGSPIAQTVNYIARYSGGNGWQLASASGTTNILFQTLASSSVTSAITVNMSELSGGWHFIAITRNASQTKMYVDGTVLGSTLNGNITAGGNLYIGSLSGTAEKLIGGVDEIWIRDGYAWVPGHVELLYARGSRRRAAINPDTTVDMTFPLEGKWFNYTPTNTGFTSSSSGFVYKVEKDTVTIDFYVSGTSNATGFTTTTPIAATNPVVGSASFTISLTVDNSLYSFDGDGYFDNGSNLLTLRKNVVSSGWTNSGTKGVYVKTFYRWQ